MSDTQETADEPKRLGLLAQFDGPDELIAAAEKATDSGYKRLDAYAPFAVIGIDEALKAKGTILPYVVATMGTIGCLIALGMQHFMNGAFGAEKLVPWLAGYDFQISGKPPESSLPAFIPVTFELIVLLSAFGAFFGMLILNKLPRLSNPLLRSDRFAEVTTDGFFLFVEADDPKYAEAETEAYLTSIGATAVEAIDEPTTGYTVPGALYLAGAVGALVATLPPLYIWMSSSTTSTVPRISFFKDMEAQAKFKAQTATPLLGDGLAARKPIDGTVARGSGMDDLPFYQGVQPEANLVDFRGRDDLRFVSRKTKAQFAADEQPPEAPAEEPEKNWVTEFPESLELTEAFMERGEQRYNIHCSACHGLAGNGDGLVSQRALSLQQGSWLTPSSMHIEAVVKQPVGRIFDTISNGRRKMPGYRESITPEDRWAIVLYIRALQRSQAASLEDVPAEMRDKLESLD